MLPPITLTILEKKSFFQGRPYIMNLDEESEEEMKETFEIPRWTDLIQCDTDL